MSLNIATRAAKLLLSKAGEEVWGRIAHRSFAATSVAQQSVKAAYRPLKPIPASLTRRYGVPAAVTDTVSNKDERREFMAVFPDVVRDLTDAGRNLDIPGINKWFAKVLQHNVGPAGGKKYRGLTALFAYRSLEKPELLTPENIRLAQMMGWCIEMLQGSLLVISDMIEPSDTVRADGSTPWYQQKGVGLQAANDAILIEAGIYHMLYKYFSNKPYYVDCLELFHSAMLKTCMGQVLDNQTRRSLDSFTMDRYNAIVRYKTGYYTFHLPVALAMHMVGMNDPEIHRQVKTILMEMGHFFQVQDDFLDCFGDFGVTDVPGTDIQDGKCTWLAVVAMQRANSQQKDTLKKSYGKQDEEKVTTVKRLYEQLNLPQMYATYEEKTYALLCTHIQQCSRGVPHDLFFKFLEGIRQRTR